VAGRHVPVEKIFGFEFFLANIASNLFLYLILVSVDIFVELAVVEWE